MYIFFFRVWHILKIYTKLVYPYFDHSQLLQSIENNSKYAYNVWPDYDQLAGPRIRLMRNTCAVSVGREGEAWQLVMHSVAVHIITLLIHSHIHAYVCVCMYCELLHCLLPFSWGVKIALRNKLINKYARNSLQIGHVFALLIFAISC